MRMWVQCKACGALENYEFQDRALKIIMASQGREDRGPTPIPTRVQMPEEIDKCRKPKPGDPLEFDPNDWPWGC